MAMFARFQVVRIGYVLRSKRMFKRSLLIMFAITLALSVATFSHSRGTLAADATVTPPPPLPTATNIPPVNLGSGGTHLAFWNGLTGSDGSTMSDLLAGFVKD